MEAFIVFLCAVVAVVAIGIFKSGSGESHPGWSAAAQRLGLRYLQAGDMASPTISGDRHGVRIRIDTYKKSGDDSRTYTRYRVHFARSLGLGIKLIRQGPMASISRRLGSQDITTGDRDFDDAVVVKGRHPNNVVQFLTAQRRRSAVRFLSLYPSGMIEDSGIECEDRNLTRNPDRIVQVIQRMITLAESFNADSEDKSKNAVHEDAVETGDTDDHAFLMVDLHAPVPLYFESLQPPTNESTEKESTLRSFPDMPPPPVDVASTTEPTGVREEVPDEPGEAAAISSNGTDLDIESLQQELFVNCGTTSESTELFHSKYENLGVSWSGTLTLVRSYRFDLVFGHEPGTRAEFNVFESAESGPGGRAVKAVVQFPCEAEDKLRSMISRRVSFRGVLIGCDSFMKTLFLTNGQIDEVYT